ncbi:flagellar basal body-associated FliL family protein [Aliirhizobium smilacinae]|uniref:Flagellar protein FliL n=1 Tax=Aliirhizobium smilacinae TaxID=1395944 RepID=A0A5C4XSM8_9HYPH|nr:flagellar basal body-associated FliL family protein [Rhizobium smilacinae]TNM66091.1 flagellar basal body-associated FliL family protein [Rhizobium smilacinae]
MAITAEDETVPKKNTLIPMVGAVVLLSLVGGGGGWLTGKLIAPAPKPAEAAASTHAAEGEKSGEGEKTAPAVSNLLELTPILTNIGYPAENLIRLQVGLVFDGPPDPALAETVNQNIVAYLRTLSLQQLQGPRGFTYLKGDLEEIASLRSQGRVTKVLIRTFVVE